MRLFWNSVQVMEHWAIDTVMPMRLFIHATNIHGGGGRELLSSILDALDPRWSVTLFVDTRMPTSIDGVSNVSVVRVRPSILQRVLAEWRLARSASNCDVVLCFGNLPPLFPVQAKVIVFLQNRFLVDRVSLKAFRPWARLRIAVERLWFSARASSVDLFVVQTYSMQRVLASVLGSGVDTPIGVMPFVASVGPTTASPAATRSEGAIYDFIYVASAGPHKNHRVLIEAWCLLAREGHRPSLCLTVGCEDDPMLCQWMGSMTQELDLKLENVGTVAHARVLELYHQAHAMIYPSTLESFGLPLIEAQAASLPVLASERDYVRDIIDPEETFDPMSALSIARAVKRFMGIESERLQPVDACRFLDTVLKAGRRR